ncbi:MAG: hypothetical protein H8E72_04325 [Candidatus Marinimicrobia bacterium]|nr:hypothetical protein [Candidatus Neomarinimicrobiota bacterium]
MKLYILITAILFSGCAVHHHHHGHSPEIIIKEKSVRADLQWQHNVALIVIHHHHSLSKKEKKMLKRRYANHFGLGKKRVKFRFVRG